ncbi:hypothetical protein Gpo141_00013695, partial [Globisporangium polare]
FMDANEVDYILRAVHFAASEGWKFLSHYRFEASRGSWRHIVRLKSPVELSHLRGFASLMETRDPATSQRSKVDRGESLSDEELKFNIFKHREGNIVLANKLGDLGTKNHSEALNVEPQTHLSFVYEPLRWFVYPQDAVNSIECGGNPQLSAATHGPCQSQCYAPARESTLESSSIVSQVGHHERASKKPWVRSNSHPHEASNSSHTTAASNVATPGTLGVSHSKRAAAKTWVERVFVRNRSSPSPAHVPQRHAIELAASQVPI